MSRPIDFIRYIAYKGRYPLAVGAAAVLLTLGYTMKSNEGKVDAPPDLNKPANGLKKTEAGPDPQAFAKMQEEIKALKAALAHKGKGAEAEKKEPAPKKDAAKKPVPQGKERIEFPDLNINRFLDPTASTAELLRNDREMRAVIIQNAETLSASRTLLAQTLAKNPDLAPYVADSIAKGSNLSKDGKFTAALNRAYKAFIKSAETDQDMKDTLIGVLQNPDLVRQAPNIDRLTPKDSPLRKDDDFKTALAEALKAAKKAK